MKKPSISPQQRFNRILLAVVAVNLLVSIVSFTWNFKGDDSKIVYVDAIKLISKYKGIEDARKEITARNEAYRLNLDTLKLELNNIIASYEKAKQSSTASVRKGFEDQIQVKQQQLMEYEQIVNGQRQKEDQEVSAKVLEKVNDYLKRYGEKEGYTIILAATHYGNIAYGDKSLDITDKVLQGLNEEYTKMN